MQKKIIAYSKCLILLAGLVFIFSCEKEHLQPDNISSANDPLVYIEANLDSDYVYFAGGVNNYVGITAMHDTLTNFRMFDFSIQNPQLPLQSFFKISINNYQNTFGNPQTDLDSSIYPGNRSYMFPGVFFIPRYVQVNWTDASGSQFKSVANMPNSFLITSVTDTFVDAKNYKKTLIEFECYLNNNFGSTIHLTNGNATVLFSTD